MSKICYNHLLAAFLTFIRSVIVFPCKNPDSNAFSRLKIAKETLYFYVEFLAAINVIVITYYPPLVAHLKLGFLHRDLLTGTSMIIMPHPSLYLHSTHRC